MVYYNQVGFTRVRRQPRGTGACAAQGCIIKHLMLYSFYTSYSPTASTRQLLHVLQLLQLLQVVHPRSSLSVAPVGPVDRGSTEVLHGEL